MSSALRRLAPVVLAAALLVSVPARAGEKTHVVDSGESASSIAGKYYGDVKLGDFLLRYNGKADNVIRSGEKLRIPYCEVHKVGKGDTWGTLATKYLEKTSAHATVAALNGFAPGDALPAGAQIVIPVVLTWRLERGESLASLATAHYGDPNRADVLQLFNDVDDPRRLSVGETVGIPLTSIRLRKSAAADLPQKQPAAVRVTKAAPQPATKPPDGKAQAQLSTVEPKKTPDKSAAAAKIPAPKAEAEKESGSGKSVATVAKEKSDGKPVPAKPKGDAAAPPAGKEAPPTTGQKAVSKSGSAQTPTKAPEPPTRPGTAEAVAVPAVAVPKPEPTVKSSSPRFAKETRAAEMAYAEGDYARARLILEALREKSRTEGTDEERTAILRLLAYVYIAFDMRAEACGAFSSLPAPESPANLHPDLVSPRIRDALSRCASRRS